MVNVFLCLLLVSPQVWAQTPTTAAPASVEKMRLSQNDVAALVLSRSDRAVEANLNSELPRVDLARVQKTYDWFLSGQTGFERSRFESLSGYGNIEDQTLATSMMLSKAWQTGTKSSLEWRRNSYRSEYSPLSPAFTNMPAEQTQDIFGVSIEQSLWRNAFGYSDRRKVRAASMDYHAATITRAQDLQDAVLAGLKSFWGAFIAQELVKQSSQSIERYEKLVNTVRRKSSFGYSLPGELAQTQAELESKKQLLKSNSLDYLQQTDSLLEYLGLPPNKEIDFATHVELTPPPRLNPVDITTLRAYKAQAMRLESSTIKAEASSSDEHPNITLVGQVYGAGLEKQASDSVGEALSGSHPKYYVGVRFEHNFGSGAQSEETVSIKIQADLAKIRLERMKNQVEINLLNAERDAKVKYAQVQSTKEQLTLRERAMNEMNKAYTQGRTDITNVIEAMNRMFDIEVSYSRAIGDYQISLAQWVSLRDELIPDQELVSAKGGQ